MKITNFGTDGLPQPLAAWSTGVVATASNAMFSSTASNAMFSSTASNTLAVNGVTVTGAAASNYHILASSPTAAAWVPDAGGGGTVSAGSNSTRVSGNASAGASSTLWSPFDHRHDGIGTITASASNTLQRGTWNIRAGSGIALLLTDADGDGAFDTTTIENTRAAGGGGAAPSAQEHNEAAAAVLVDATAAGDAGSRADHFSGTSLGGAWSSEATAASTLTVKYSSLGINFTSGGANHQLQAFTPSGAFEVQCKVWFRPEGGGLGLFVRDSGTGDASGEGIMTFIDGASALVTYSLDAGAFNSRQSTAVSQGASNGWHYLSIARDGSNVWTSAWSKDRTIWKTLSTWSKTFTVAKVGFRFGTGYSGVDFFDVAS